MGLISDFHSHVSYTSVRAMAQSAQGKGLQSLGISEHVYQLIEGRYQLEHLTTEGPFLKLSDYIEQIHQSAKELEFDIRLGLEVDFIPGKNKVIQAALKDTPWDYLIGSVHEIDGLEFEGDYSWAKDEGETLWMRYFELLRGAVESSFFQVVSHPVRMGIRNPHLPASFDAELERLATLASDRNVALELNGKDVLTYPHLVHRLMKACAKYKTPVSVGSDAHYPEKIAQAHAQSEQILGAYGINRVRIWKQKQAEDYVIA